MWPEILVHSPAALSRGAVRSLIGEAEKRRVRVIETSEAVLGQISKRGNPQTVIGAYNISKAADFQLARNLAAEFGPKGVRVNCIAPGLIKTDFARALWENPDTLKAVTRATPLRRIGEPHEIAGAAVFLASPASTFMTGQTMVVDGGSMIGVGL